MSASTADGALDPNRLSDLLAEHATPAGVVGATLGIGRGEDQQVMAFGEADGSGRQMTSDTRIPIASVTKPMVATVLARLAVDGRLDLGDPVARHVRELERSSWAQAATVRQLLANTSGMPLTAETEWLVKDDGPEALAGMALRYADSEAMWPAGQVWSYSNGGWNVLGRLIECVTGMSWEEATRVELLEPLGMGETEFGPRSANGPRSELFDIGPDGPSQVQPWMSRALGPGGGWVWSTVSDLVRFGRVHCDDPALALLREEQAHPALRWFLDSWCLGLARFDGPDVSVWGWDGIGSGARTILRILPEQRGVLALASNSSTGRSLYRTLFPVLWAEIFGVDLPTPRFSEDVPHDLSVYEGRFGWTDMETSISAEKDHLVMSTGSDRTILRPLDARNFTSDEAGVDQLTHGFAEFHNGVPQVFHHLVWGMPRLA